MRLFERIFGRNTKIKIANKNLPLIWEDDYCQIEIVPRKNIENINQSIKQINEYTEKTKTDFGFTNIFMRESHPFPTLNEELRIDSIETFLTEKGFEKAKQIRYEGYKIINCSNKTSNVLCLPFFNFFYDSKEEFINNIWVSISLITSIEYFNKILETLYELGESFELILIDWNTFELIDLSDKKQIKNYLMSY